MFHAFFLFLLYTCNFIVYLYFLWKKMLSVQSCILYNDNCHVVLLCMCLILPLCRKLGGIGFLISMLLQNFKMHENCLTLSKNKHVILEKPKVFSTTKRGSEQTQRMSAIFVALPKELFYRNLFSTAHSLFLLPFHQLDMTEIHELLEWLKETQLISNNQC